ncbi:DUF2182 domain-containing protein [Nitrospira sp. M1]
MASFPQRDTVAITSALIGVTVLAWAYLFHLAASMSDMSTRGVVPVMQLQPWTGTDFLFMLLMWIVMMIGMMLPSATPMTLLYAGMARKANRQGTPIAPTSAFVSGYLAIWGIFSGGATLTQAGLHQAALLSPMMMTNSHTLGAGLLLVAGLYQLTPWKNVCLEHCRSPTTFIAKHWRTGITGAFRMGLEHGLYCLGCCWALMGLLFFGGVMNLLWIAGITIFVFLEKVLPVGAWSRRLSGGGLLVTGGGLLMTSLTH